MSRLGAAVAAAIGSLAVACSGGDAESTPPLDSPDSPGSTTTEPGTGETPDSSDPNDSSLPGDDEWGLAFSLVGREVPMTARAEVKIIEGENAVHVTIDGRTSGTDALTIDLTFEGLQNALGPHLETFSLPDDGAHMVNGSLDGNWYYSQGGTIDLTVSRDGEIRGTFDIALALGEMAPGEPVVFEASEEAVQLGGEFSGSWVLNCHSRLPGHGTTIPGGDYCAALEY